jgi:superfamily II DNA/RNA helicase
MRRKKPGSLRSVAWKRFIHAPDAELLEALYVPALSRAVRYDRCCAYFSSSVLSTAARGFGGFIQNLLALGDAAPKPSARLLVNEQLNPRDLDALLATGDDRILGEKLLKQFKTPQEAVERCRLEMLAWLVASGLMEVRVGLMRRTRGILHAKYGVVTDTRGNRLAFMGSGNETGEALTENYEELEVRTSWQDAEFVENYERQFETIWNGQDADVACVPLPDAVRERLVAFAPEEPPVEEIVSVKETASVAMLWRFLAEAGYFPNGDAACDATAFVDLWPHQRRVVEDVSKAFPEGRLLCDEVGMGKTIEAVVALKRLQCGRGVRRALLLVPAGLLRQWQEELREKGGLLVPVWDNGFIVHADGRREPVDESVVFGTHDVLLVSREWARLVGHRERLLTAPTWDLVLLDEAHAARRARAEEGEFNSGNLLLDLLRQLQLKRRTRGILLLSATPMQTQPWEPWDLLSVLGVGGGWLAEFRDIRSYYEGIEELRDGMPSAARARAMARLSLSDPSFPCAPGDKSYASVDELAKDVEYAIGNERGRFAEWFRKGSPLARRMHRNTRETLRQYHRQGLLDTVPSERDVQDVLYDYEDVSERKCYDAVRTYINKRFDALEGQKKGKGFVMTIYLRRASSSPLAIRRSLGRRREKLEGVAERRAVDGSYVERDEELDARDLSDADADVERVDPALPTDLREARAEINEMDALIAHLDALGATDSKFAVFLKGLRDLTGSGRRALVFTEYTDTMEYLREQLRHEYGDALACYSGQGGSVRESGTWKTVPKAEITERLTSGEIRVLLCTDAASEGLNLQAANALINYDLPWNPSKVEQRIGRIDRIGQRESLLPIRNLFLRNSVDMKVYQALRTRCRLFEQFVGRMQPVLERARTALLRDSLRPEGVQEFLAALEEELRRIESDPLASSVFSDAAADARADETTPSTTRGDFVEALTMTARTRSGLTIKRMKEPESWRIGGLRGRSVMVTTSRETLERDVRVEPLTVGAPIVEELRRQFPLSSRVPLVLASSESGSFRCVEARWVGKDSIERLASAKELRTRLDNWDGAPVSPELRVRASKDAEAEARRRLMELVHRAREREEHGLSAQVEAARLRLLRELGRTLRCFGGGDLRRLLAERVRYEKQSGSLPRYEPAQKRLAGHEWTTDDVRDVEVYVEQMNPSERKARTAGSVLDAALNDPRWEPRA